ncbi:alpha/beta fold hydrolase [Anatilimnocola sp. NA78]|uniref:alpha/beta fold hydrolase n=1 Tax=Anatilimnocola sp. NA78 TaxID=3415683 RepID=UPI003CE4D767
MGTPINDDLTWHFSRLNHRTDSTGPGTKCLVVFVPGLFSGWPGFRNYDDLLTLVDRAIVERFSKRDFLPVSYLATFWSPSDPDQIARKIGQQIDELTQQQHYDAIVIVSHSFGGLLARRLLILSQQRPWFRKLDRVLFLASTSRGLHPATRLQSIAVTLGKRLGGWSYFGGLALAGMKPSPWLTSLSNDWRALLASTVGQRLQVVQLLGELDRVVDPGEDDDLLSHAHFQKYVMPAARHRYFMLRRVWFDQVDAEVGATLRLTQQFIENALR